MKRQWLLWVVVLAVGAIAAALFAGCAPARAGTLVVINDTPVPPMPTLDKDEREFQWWITFTRR